MEVLFFQMEILFFRRHNFLEEFQARRNENKKLAFICRGGHRSMMAANFIKNELGLESVNLDGGMLALKGLI